MTNKHDSLDSEPVVHSRRDFQSSANIHTCASLDFDRTINSYSIQAARARALLSAKKDKKDEKEESGPSSEVSELLPHHRRHPTSQKSLLVETFSNDDPFLVTKQTVRMNKMRASRKSIVTAEDMTSLLTLTENAPSFDSMDSNTSMWSGEGSAHPFQRVSRTLKISMSGKVIAKWIFTCFVGLFVGLAAILIVDGVGRLVRYRQLRLNDGFARVYGYNSEKIEHAIPFFHPRHFLELFFWFTFVSFVPAILSGIMCVYYAPAASGSGIPEVKAYLNGVRVKSFSQFSLLFVKIFGTILSVASGLAIGPEGPLVHIGAIIGSSVTKTGWLQTRVDRFGRAFPRLSSVMGCGPPYEKYGSAFRRLRDEANGVHTPDEELPEEGFFSKVRYGASRLFSQFLIQASLFRNDPERRDFITIGSAAGFAAAFGAPVGGVLYGLEETSTFFATSLLWKTLNATAIATFCIAVYHGGLDKFSVLTLNLGANDVDLTLNRFAQLPYYALVGLLGGLLGAFFNSTILYINVARKNFYANRKRGTKTKQYFRLLEVSILSVVTSVLIFFCPLVLSTACNPVTDPEEQESWQFNCKPGEYNELGKVLLGTRDDAILDILSNTESYKPTNLLLIGVVFYFLQIITFGVSLPSGIFMPTILTGASLGGYLGFVIKQYDSEVSPSVFALLGAAALLSGMQRTTVSLCVILMEGTGQTKVLIPVIITVVIACYVGNLINHGIYEVVMELKEFAYLEHHEGNLVYDMFRVSDIMSTPVVVMNSVETAGTIENILQQTTHNGFPVIDKKTKNFLGMVRRDQLVALLECGAFVSDKYQKKNGQKPDFYSKNPLSVSVMERNPSLIARTFALRDDQYGSTVNINPLIPKGEGLNFCVKICPSFCFEGNHHVWPVATNGARDAMKEEHEWLADNVTLHGKSEIIDETLPVTKLDADGDDERAVVDIDKNHNVIVHLPEHFRAKEVDVEAVMNRGAHVILEGCPLSKAYELFTKMGLRHLTVIGGASEGKVVGIITRHNLLEEHLEEATGFKLH